MVLYPDYFNRPRREDTVGWPTAGDVYDLPGGGPLDVDNPEGGGAPAPPSVPAPSVPGTGGGGGGTGGGGGGGGANMSIGRPNFHFRDAPMFKAPVFRAPTFAEAQQEPGYQFRLSGGADALERSAAARGVLRTGGTLRDIEEYGQNFAAQEYGNVYNRALQGFDRNYRGAWDEFTPRFDEWKFLSAAEQAAAMAQYQLMYRNTGGGGGGGSNYANDLANNPAPGAPIPPPFLWKPNHPDADRLNNWRNY